MCVCVCVYFDRSLLEINVIYSILSTVLTECTDGFQYQGGVHVATIVYLCAAFDSVSKLEYMFIRFIGGVMSFLQILTDYMYII